MKRELTEIEKLWVHTALNQEPKLTDEERVLFKDQIKSIRVTEECDCDDPNCGSMKFSGYKKGTSVGFADGIMHEGTKDEMRVILFLNDITNEISELETVK